MRPLTNSSVILSLLSSVFALQIALSGQQSEVSLGDTVGVVWTRNADDPFSFGVMQHSLQNGSLISVTAVENQEQAVSGTVDVTYIFTG